MSITNVETMPEGQDIVAVNDPGQDAVDPQPNPGTDTLAPDALTHIGAHGRGRDVRNHPSMDRMPGSTARDAGTGTVRDPERYIHDQALQVRQLLPTRWDVTPVALAAGNPVQLVPVRPERMGVQVFNNGPATVYIGPMLGKAGVFSGWPLLPGASQVIDSLDQVWASIDPVSGASADVRVLETWRTDNTGN